MRREKELHTFAPSSSSAVAHPKDALPVWGPRSEASHREPLHPPHPMPRSRPMRPASPPYDVHPSRRSPLLMHPMDALPPRGYHDTGHPPLLDHGGRESRAREATAALEQEMESLNVRKDPGLMLQVWHDAKRQGVQPSGQSYLYLLSSLALAGTTEMMAQVCTALPTCPCPRLRPVSGFNTLLWPGVVARWWR